MPNMSYTSRSGHSLPGQMSVTESSSRAGSGSIPDVSIDGSRKTFTDSRRLCE